MIADDRQSAQTEKELARVALIRKVKHLKTKGYSNAAIGRQLSLNESSVRSLLSSET